jgi:hypothetical protein
VVVAPPNIKKEKKKGRGKRGEGGGVRRGRGKRAMILKVKYPPSYSTKFFDVENSPPVNVFQQVRTCSNMSQQVLTGSNGFQQVPTDCAGFQRVPPNMDTRMCLLFLDFFVKKR